MKQTMVRSGPLIVILWAISIIASDALAQERMIVDGHQLIYDLSESSGLPEDDRMILPDDHLRLAEPLLSRCPPTNCSAQRSARL